MPRALLLGLLFLGCEDPTPPAKLLVELSGEAPFELLAGTTPIDLLYLHAGCIERRQLRLTNLGPDRQRFTLDSLSLELELTAAPLDLAPQETGTAELAFWPRVSGPHRSVLTIKGSAGFGATLMFTAIVFEFDHVDLPSPVDFGGVPLGATQTSNLRLSGLTGDFSSDGGTASFTPSALGPQRTEAIWTEFASCPSLSTARVLGDGVQDALIAPASVTFPTVDAGALSRVNVSVDNFTRDSMRVSLLGPDAGAPFLLLGMTETAYGVATRDDAGTLVPSHIELDLGYAAPPGGGPGPVMGRLLLETPLEQRTVNLTATANP